jgi:hypothetical protein
VNSNAILLILNNQKNQNKEIANLVVKLSLKNEIPPPIRYGSVDHHGNFKIHPVLLPGMGGKSLYRRDFYFLELFF